MAQQRPNDEERIQKIQKMLGFEPQPVQQNGGGDEPPEKPPVDDAPEPDKVSKEGGFKFALDREKFLRALWTIASVISMTVTIVVLIIAVILFRNLKHFPVEKILALLEEKGEALPPDLDIEQVGAITEKTIDNMPPEIGVNTPLDLLKGLYDNFELMDDAHIKTEIIVKDEIPVAFTLGLNQNTTVVLSENVTIPGARVALTTGGLNIFNAPATVTLPKGTELPITLSLDVPVDEMIAIELHVPVDIALSETDLHKPFVGLQDVVQPLYCLVKSDALSAKGQFICMKEPGE